MDMKERLKRARLQRGLTQEKAGELVGVTENSIYRYEAGTVSPSETALKMMAQVYGQPVDWFYGEEEQAEARQGQTGEGQSLLDDDLKPITLATDFVGVTMIGSISAGGLVEGWQEDLGEAMVPRDVRRAAPKAFALKVTGDSLASHGIQDGDVVLVDPAAPFVDGRLYAVRSEEHNQTIAARQVFDMGRRWKLMAGDGSTVDVHKNRSEILGRIRWSVPSIREH